ncbi:hypothetical protein [Agrococcus jejuensis]|uniref:hypothetical protein n=1 Tax=Agrococcus jejuensis TaxID=399736 RepID=UPI0011A5BC15|nr:hypothetical protein [Agrococcus jejuensis]
MSEVSVWKTWKPYAVLAVVGVGGGWWYLNQAPFAPLNDGTYACTGVYVNESGKYETLTDAAGNGFSAEATVRDGVMTSLSGSAPFDGQRADLVFHSRGTSHFHVTDDAATRMYYAMACDHIGQ